jgi:hypothetical protein
MDVMAIVRVNAQPHVPTHVHHGVQVVVQEVVQVAA